MQEYFENEGRSWLPGRRWLGVIAFVAVVAVGIVAIRYFVFGSFAMTPGSERSIEASWVDTIEKLGIEPRYPPEEDFVVGDLLALVIKDDENAGLENKIPDPRTASFLQRAVKLSHVDVNKALSEEYSQLPVFPDLAESPPLDEPEAGKPAVLKKKLTRDFAQGVRLKDLPLASFPRLRIQGTTSAGGSASGGGFLAAFGASNNEVEELELGEVRTYGLPSIRASELLESYCTAEPTKAYCTEETAREHLRPVTKNRSVLKYVINANGEERYAMTVEVVMVYRVYVTRSIKNLRQASRAQGGSGQFVGAGSDVVKIDAPPAGASSDVMKQHIDELQRQLSALKSNSAKFQAGFNRESAFDGNFDRPVAIGFRGIRVDFDNLKAKMKKAP